MRRWLWVVVLVAGGCLERNKLFVEPTETDGAGGTTAALTGGGTDGTTAAPHSTTPAGDTTDGPSEPTTGSPDTEWPLDTESTFDPSASTGMPAYPVCGNGVTEPGETCDDGNVMKNDECVECQLAKCGDGEVQDGAEQCDDGNDLTGDQCEPDCTEPVRYIFVTSEVYEPSDLQGLSGADELCTELAILALLPGEYMAWLSTFDNSPALRMTKSAWPYVRSDKVPVAMNWGDLTDGSLLAPIELDEHGDKAPQKGPMFCEGGVFSNTTTAGLPNNVQGDCGGWHENGGYTSLGTSASKDENWTIGCAMDDLCGLALPIFCVQQ